MTPRASSGRVARPVTFIHGESRLARLARPIARFLHVEAAGGILLLVATAIALVWANSPWSAAYDELWATRVQLTIGSFHFDEDLHHVVNDLLMALFFFVVGMEIKRELVTGELRDRRRVVLPAVAAFGGMVVPALIFAAFNAGGEGSSGWGIPMATDIAFALGVLAVLGPRVPSPLKVFLLTLAIADDIGSIVVIAVFYADDVRPASLLVAAAITGAVALLRRLHVTWSPLYVVGGIALWVAVFESGVHATIAGVVMGLLAPATPVGGVPADLVEPNELEDLPPSRCDRLLEALHPWSSYLIVPVFALANAGVRLDTDPLAERGVFLGVLLGLVVGKTLGITGFAWLATRTRFATLPPEVRWIELVATAAVAGIGFTVSLFIAGLAYSDDALASSAKLGILAASALAAVIGAALFLAAARRRPPPPSDVLPG